MQTEADRIATGLRLTTNRIGTLISAIRGDGRRGRDASVRAAEYLAEMRRNYANIVRAEEIGANVSAFTEMNPIPYRSQLVGLSEAERNARKWLGVRECLSLPVIEPVRFLEAAE
ncbi:hypothetical protein [Shinella sp. M27]|uniref:hypothetical protein n=1 Tax=Shinella sp. M27 TaxID=3368614 RepID=UPI003BA14983